MAADAMMWEILNGLAYGMSILFIFFIMSMPKESWHHFNMKIGSGKTSVTMLRPTGMLQNLAVTYKDEALRGPKETVLLTLDLLKDIADDEDKKKYNELIRRPAIWEGSRAPGVLASEYASITATPAMVEELTKAKNEPEFSDIKDILEKIAKAIPESTKRGNYRVSIAAPMDIDTLTEYVNTPGPASKIKKIFTQGRLTGIWETTQKSDFGEMAKKMVIPIGLIVLLLVLWQAGIFDGLLEGGASII